MQTVQKVLQFGAGAFSKNPFVRKCNYCWTVLSVSGSWCKPSLSHYWRQVLCLRCFMGPSLFVLLPSEANVLAAPSQILFIILRAGNRLYLFPFPFVVQICPVNSASNRGDCLVGQKNLHFPVQFLHFNWKKVSFALERFLLHIS